MNVPPNRPNPWPQFFYSLAFGSLLGGLVIIWMHSAELGDLDSQHIEEALIVRGRLEIPSHTSQSTPIAVREKDGSVWKCYIGHCGYPGIREDLGKEVKAWILSGKIVQIEVNGEIKLLFADRIAKLKSNTVGYIFLLLTPLFGLLGFVNQRFPSPENQNNAQ